MQDSILLLNGFRNDAMSISRMTCLHFLSKPQAILVFCHTPCSPMDSATQQLFHITYSIFTQLSQIVSFLCYADIALIFRLNVLKQNQVNSIRDNLKSDIFETFSFNETLLDECQKAHIFFSISAVQFAVGFYNFVKLMT